MSTVTYTVTVASAGGGNKYFINGKTYLLFEENVNRVSRFGYSDEATVCSNCDSGRAPVPQMTPDPSKTAISACPTSLSRSAGRPP